MAELTRHSFGRPKSEELQEEPQEVDQNYMVYFDLDPLTRSHVLHPSSRSLFDQRVPSLDGLRAIAIIWVMLCHILIGNWMLFWNQRPALMGVLGNGWLGVDIFFVISGFIITGLLLREQRNTGRIALGSFFIRRAIRILPPFFAMILTVLALRDSGVYTVSDADFLAATFFYMNYHVHYRDCWPLVHTWSLSIEEQFYLVWPTLFRFFRPRGALTFALIVFAISPFVRAILIRYAPDPKIGEYTHTHADMLMAGCALAIACENQIFIRVCNWLFRLKFPIIGAIYLFGFSTRFGESMNGDFGYYFGYTINSLLIGLFLIWTVRYPETWVGQILNSRVMIYIGTLSYSLYLWQKLFTTPLVATSFTRLPWNLPLIFCVAEISRRFIERPALNWREKRFPSLKPQSAPTSPTTAAGF